MAQPTAYTRAYNFANFQAVSPNSPLPANQVEAEYNRIKRTLDETLANLAKIQRDDGEVKNQTIGFDQLKPEINGFGTTAPTLWETATSYSLRDAVFFEGNGYVCVTAHTSGVFATDLAAEKWQLFFDLETGLISGGNALPVMQANSMLVTNSGGTARAEKTFAEVRDLLDTAPYVATRTALKALDTTKDTVSILKEAGREGIFNWKTGDYSTQIAADTAEGIYIKANAIASTVGAWVRVFDGIADIRWWGAVVDGGTNDTAAVNAFIAQVNAGLVKSVLIPHGTTMVGKLTAVTADDVTWLWLGKFKNVANSLGVAEPLLSVTGDRHRNVGMLEIDGNAAAYAAGVSCQLLDYTGDGHSFDGVFLHHSAGRGFVSDGMTNFKFGSFIIEDNAGLGAQFARCAYGTVFNNRVRRNGCGFGKTKTNAADISHDFVGFGVAVRYTSHDIDFIGGDYTFNGRDGLNVNQGSYNIKHVALRANANDDGGLTIAQDNVGSGLPGDGEPCYNISYIDCDTENNFTSGIVSYGAVHGLVIRGGVQKNNHRLAGNLVQATSYYNGVFVTSGSTGVDIDTMAYDDRQERFVTSVSGSGSTRTITVAAWAQLKNTYPKVAIYQANGAFRGWGDIVSETATTVTISSTAQNGVTLANIIAGDIITQATQLNGVLLENNVAGQARVRGATPRVGPSPSIQGQVCQLATTAGAGGALLLDGLPSVNLLTNGSFDAGITGWTFSNPAGGSSALETTIARSAGSLKLVGGTVLPNDGDAALLSGTIKKINGSKWRFRGWAYSTEPGAALVRFFTNTGPDVVHTWQSGGRGWEPFVISGGFNGSNAVIPRVVASVGKTVYFDECFFETIDEAPMRSIESREY